MEVKITSIETNVNVGNRQPAVNAMTVWKDNNINESFIEERDNFLNGAYQPPLAPKEVDPNIELHCRECCKQAQVNKITYNKGKVGNENKITNLKKEKYEAQFQVYKLNKEKRTLSQKLDKCQQKLGSLSMRNVNKRIKRRNEKIQTLMEENKKLKNQKQHLQALTRKIRLKYKQRAAMLKYYNNKVNNFKNKQVNKVISRNIEQKNEGKQMLEENQNLKQHVYFLENENEEMKERLEELMKNKEITTFENGKYNDTVREVYAVLLAANVGVKNVEHIVKTVLNKLGGVKIDRLPKKTFAEIMLVEAKALAQIQSVDAMINSDACTLHTDGTKRKGREYGGLQVGTSSGQYSLGILELSQGTAESFFNMIKTIFTNLGELTDKENKNKKAAEIIVTIKNMMTDRHIVNTSLKNLVEKWKSECLPLVIENYDTFNADMKKSLLDINHFKCNLHVLVNLGTQAEAALKEWAKTIIVSDTLPSDSFSHSTPDFIRASTKLCVPGADHKSGCRALGIIDKLCTGPLWRQIEESKHILDLNNVWLNFYNFLDEFSKDSSDLLRGKVIYPDYTIKDEVNNSLFMECEKEIDILTIEALQILCTNFLIIIKRQLGDNLPGGKFSVDSAENFENLKNISKNVSSTNIISERDFANLDRLTREKPNANTNAIAVEGMILFTNNKTLQWLDSLNPDKKTEVFKIARENAPKMIKNYRKQKIVIKEKHIELTQ
ncbi:unnamed protein product [Mytilus edulis]|uniref:Uncharacterized protein n=1 Tax=Mytilus edulis TaxID=6550 RepID=A0A8S3SMH2_MYTED|nr:unnamed protein product [Mytilus edulis]